MLVIYLFLRNVRATLIPSLSVPLSLIGTFAVMYLADFSLNNLSLMALTIATGFVVDDAIVMIENIARYIEQGERPLQAALKGAGPDRLHHHLADRLADRRVDSPAVHAGCGGTAVPRIRGDPGRHHPDLRGCVADARAHDVREPAEASPGTAHEAGRVGWFARMVAWYGRKLTWVLDHQRLTLWVAVATLVITAGLYVVIPKGFFPDQDTGLIQGVSDATGSVSYAAMAERQQALAAAILKDPDVASLSSFIGVDGNNVTLNSGRFLINLKPRDARSVTATRDHPPAAQRDHQCRPGHDAVHAAGTGPDPGQHSQPDAIQLHAGERGCGGAFHLDPQARFPPQAASASCRT